jgi:hypothetical protein
MGTDLLQSFIYGNIRLDLCNWAVAVRHRVETQVTSCEICGVQSGTGAGLSSQFFGFPQSFIIPPLHHSHPAMRPELCDNHDQAAHHHILGILSWGLHL